MSAKERITVDVDADLHARLERVAQARQQDLADAVSQALALWTADRCPTCGRVNEVQTVAAGMTDEFRGFVDEYKNGNLGFATITTLEEGEQRAYWVRIRGDRPMEGLLMVYALLDDHGRVTLPIGIPRGVITGWRGDLDGTWYGMCVALGYVDGNAAARQVALLMQRKGEL